MAEAVAPVPSTTAAVDLKATTPWVRRWLRAEGIAVLVGGLRAEGVAALVGGL